ncbi:MAG: hypothetical protein KIT84_26510 [Labilithrix sp.]|nr:hypothetical protein [Labilithrix sp.]MCW5814606.1 hypothetical protein [Labilithrix sp.]
MSAADHLAAAGRALLAAADELRATGGPTTIFSTGPGGALPPGRSRRWLRDHAAEIGGTRVGGKRGRGVAWLVTREQYDAWLASQGTARVEPAPAATVIPIDALIASAGFRATRSA